MNGDGETPIPFTVFFRHYCRKKMMNSTLNNKFISSFLQICLLFRCLIKEMCRKLSGGRFLTDNEFNSWELKHNTFSLVWSILITCLRTQVPRRDIFELKTSVRRNFPS